MDKAHMLTLSAPEMTVLVGGLRVLDANTARPLCQRVTSLRGVGTRHCISPRGALTARRHPGAPIRSPRRRHSTACSRTDLARRRRLVFPVAAPTPLTGAAFPLFFAPCHLLYSHNYLPPSRQRTNILFVHLRRRPRVAATSPLPTHHHTPHHPRTHRSSSTAVDQ